ncbi:MAG: DUF4249 family protein [Bacteroidetes bacterium]|nr:DUF4249 family protein [Bacteroidota bacterium]
MQSWTERLLLRRSFLLPALLLLLLSGPACEQVLDNSELPFTEVLVVRAVLKDGDIVDSLYIGRTLPYEESPYGYYDEVQKKTVYPDLNGPVTDAAVTIIVNGVRYPLTHHTKGNYRNDSLVTHAGTTYRLEALWNGKKAEAVTTVPASPVVDSVTVRTVDLSVSQYTRETDYTCTGYVRSAANTALLMTVMRWDSTKYFNGTDSIRYAIGYSIGKQIMKRNTAFAQAPEKMILVSKQYEYAGRDRSNSWMAVRVTVYDGPYYRYYTSGTNGSEDGSFSFERTPIAWNVTGEAIGMFIGASSSVVKNISLH